MDWNMKNFMKGASILTISAIVVKLLGAVYRVPYQNLVGDKGFYIYQQVYPFIGIFIIWTSYGFAVAVSKLLAGSQSDGEAKAITRVAFTYLLFLSIVIFLLLLILAPFFAQAMGDLELIPLLRASAAIVLLMPALAVYKGIFQSQGRMTPVAISGIGEQTARVVFILAGTWIAIKAGASLYKAGEIAIWGAAVGEAVGVIILALYFKNQMKSPLEKINRWQVMKELTFISISVSASALILLLYQLVDSFTVYNILLSKGFGKDEAMATKGIYDRGQPLVQMGILIATTLALAIVPLIAHQLRKQSGRSAIPFIQLTYRVAFLFGVAASLGLALVLPYVNEMLFETRAGTFPLIVFVCQIFWLSLILPLTAILQGTGKVKIPTILLFGSLLVKVIANIVLVPQFLVLGASIAGNIGFIFVIILLLLYFKRIYPTQLASRRFYFSVVKAAFLMCIVVIPWMVIADWFLFDQMHSRLSATFIALSSVMLGASIFLFIVMKNRALQEKEWFLLPFGKRLATVQLWLNQSEKRR